MNDKTVGIGMVFAILAVIGCSEKQGNTEAKDKKIDLTAQAKKVNELVPAELKDTLVFSAKSLDDGDVHGITPDGWEEAFMPGEVRGPKGSAWEEAEMRVSSNCDGSCVNKEWAPIAEKVLFKAYTGKYKKVQTDEPWPSGGRLVISTDPGGTYIVLAMWTDKSDRYFSCMAKVPKDQAAAVPAFTEACKAMQPVWK